MEKALPYLTCTACGQWFKDPRLLNCLHSFCFRCLEMMVEVSAGDESKLIISCPTCQEATAVSGISGCDSLPPNLLAANMLAVMPLHYSNTLLAPEEILCGECVLNAIAVCKCNDCLLFLCEQCRRSHERRKTTNNHKLISLQELKEAGPSAGRKQLVCSKHPGEALLLYCETCEELVCRDCSLTEHERHHKEFLSVVSERARLRLRKLTTQVVERSTPVQDSINDADCLMLTIESRTAALRLELNKTFDMVIKAMEDRRSELLQQLDALRALKVNSLRLQRDGFTKSVKVLKAATDFSTQCLENGNDAEIAALQSTTQRRLMDLLAMNMELAPHQDDYIELIFGSELEIVKHAAESLGHLNVNSKNLWRAQGEGLRHAWRHRAAMFQLLPPTNNDALVGNESVQAWIRCGDSRKEADVTRQRDGSYSILYVANFAGESFVHVMVNDMHVRGSPFRVMIKPSRDWNQVILQSQRMFGSLGVGNGQLRNPVGIAWHSDTILVAESSNHRIQAFNEQGCSLFSFGGYGSACGKLKGPCGLCIDGMGHVIVADEGNNRICIFTEKGTFLRDIGVSDSMQLANEEQELDREYDHGYDHDNRNNETKNIPWYFQASSLLTLNANNRTQTSQNKNYLSRPWGVAVNKNGHVVVSEQGHHRISVLTMNGQIVNSFGSYGAGAGQFCTPAGIAIDAAGNYVVVDQGNHRIQVFRPNGEFIREFGGKGNKNYQFSCPSGVAINCDGDIIVSDSGNHRIAIFGSDGEYLCHFGTQGTNTGQLRHPSGVCVDNNRNVYVAEWGGNRIQIF